MTYAFIEEQPDYDAVQLLLHRLLDAVCDVWSENDIGLPERRYIAGGPVAMDCEQVTVQLMQLYLGTPGTPPGTAVKCESARSAMIRINILRKAPALGPRAQFPTAEAITQHTEEVARDMWLLFAVPARVNDLNGGILADVDPIPTQGGYSGCGMNLTITVP